MVVNKTDTGIYTGDVGEGEQYPGLQDLIDSLTNRANERMGGMMGNAFLGDRGANKTSQIEQLAMDMMGYGQQEQSGGIAGALMGTMGAGGRFGFAQGGFGAGTIDALRAWGGGVGSGMSVGIPRPQFGLGGPMNTALQEARERARSAMAVQKRGRQRGGASGTVTSNITG